MTMSPGPPRSFKHQLKDALRPIARRFKLAPPAGAWDALGYQPWTLMGSAKSDEIRTCNICNWSGLTFNGPFHCEMAECPRCGSIARDRFLLLCYLSRTPYSKATRVLETSPRLGMPYRRMMSKFFDYTASDFDLSAHEGDIQIDLQDINLPTESVDVLLTPHVLEHVPNTRIALQEIHRVLSPGGKMYLQVPLCRGLTKVPETPEFHADNTKVFFNFGWDLTNELKSSGFQVRVLITEEFHAMLLDRVRRPANNDPEFDIESMWENAPTSDLAIVADRATSDRYGFLPAHQFVTWECIKL